MTCNAWVSERPIYKRSFSYCSQVDIVARTSFDVAFCLLFICEFRLTDTFKNSFHMSIFIYYFTLELDIRHTSHRLEIVEEVVIYILYIDFYVHLSNEDGFFWY